ncbi:hypothetical protein SASPL_144601 [Salvia splendens]|uniref:Uncharacterized protein n=1 Tax=Salvia splendens TaxID=180675 RepID=A0A8X8WG44_SALSN|nr:hypothetical protein SASPL_144601 [Salvia splendens]
MAERRHGGRRGDARSGGRGGGCGYLPNEEARDIENGDLRQQVRDLQRRLARLEKRQGKSNPMRSMAPERRSMDDPLFSDVFTSYDADEPSKNSNSNIFSMPTYDTPVYDEDIFYELPEPSKNSNSNILSLPVYNKPVYDEDIFYELPGMMSKSSPPFVKFDDAVEDEGGAIHNDEEYDEVEGGKPPPSVHGWEFVDLGTLKTLGAIQHLIQLISTSATLSTNGLELVRPEETIHLAATSSLFSSMMNLQLVTENLMD